MTAETEGRDESVRLGAYDAPCNDPDCDACDSETLLTDDMETVFTQDMTQPQHPTTHEAVEFPSAKEVREALHTLDLLICAAQDAGTFTTDAVAELEDAFEVFDKFMEHPDAREPRA